MVARARNLAWACILNYGHDLAWVRVPNGIRVLNCGDLAWACILN